MLFEGKVSPCRLLKISAEVGLDQRRALRLLCKEWSMDLETFMVVLQDGEEQGEMNGSRLKDTASDELQGILYSPIDRKQLRKTLQHCRVEYQEALANMKESDAHLIAMRMLPSIVDDIMLLREEVGVYPAMLLEIAQNLRSSSSDDSEADMPGIDFSRRESSFSHGLTDYDQEEVGCSSDCKQVGRLTAALLCIADTVRRCFLSKSRERRKKVCEPTG
ncbi:hypothetical protein GUITHDRAFT_116348 [Guillardia theta CCMP2712]|uniref:Uncharacterized protein n=1 Tax=Guillardia theta (strain CCMP2712) TaxID=905079 RepID=L1INS5_GUITC|nr:hypothetical protein GUITHDRAFT_116348 [Guillardia theta CCMP2712]EKX37539.1 hypothetical protein GUITHDRAFT_116348 [Guillardia theta CCMP2712]|eukprot:XP_005824519.1 hypothetical protein GUITHDRAFT_116348 [Guillardia theta CCMP2712]